MLRLGRLSDAKQDLSLNLVVEVEIRSAAVLIRLLPMLGKISLQLCKLIINITGVVQSRAHVWLLEHSGEKSLHYGCGNLGFLACVKTAL